MKTFKVSNEDFFPKMLYFKIFQTTIPLRVYKPHPICSHFSFEKGEKSQGALSGELDVWRIPRMLYLVKSV